MDLLLGLFVFMFGLVVGSFLNVVILRLHTGRTTLGRSGCMSCRVQLSFYQLIPVLSFVVLSGRCAACGSRISKQYPIVELLTALLFVLVWFQDFSLTEYAIVFPLIAVMVVILVYDSLHTIIPDSAVYIFAALCLMWGLVHVYPLDVFAVGALVFSGVLVTAPLFLLWLVSAGTWMGLGDSKLAIGIGWALGLYGGATALMLGFVIGAVVGVVLLYAPRVVATVIKHASLRHTLPRFTMKSEIPFAPFLLLGFVLVFFFNVDLVALMGTIL